MPKAIPDLFTEGATLSKFIHEGRPTTTKPTFVALPSLTSHSTFYRCSRSILCKPQGSPYIPLTRLGVIISYSLRMERKITLPLTSTICWNIMPESTPKKLIYSTSRSSITFEGWYPSFHLPYQIEVKVTCTGFYVYVEIIYIDSSPDPEILSPYVYSKPSDETIQRLYGIPSKENNISNH